MLNQIKSDQLIELKNLIIRKSRHASLVAKIILNKVLFKFNTRFKEKLDAKMLKF